MWRTRRSQFDLYVSPLVIQETAGGDPLRARRRLTALKEVPVLDATLDAMRLAEALAKAGAIPSRAVVDATHIAIATVHGMN